MLSRNRIKRLPNSVSKLTSLTTLWLDVNQLEFITPALAFATRLKSLKLNLNNLTTLPPEFCKLVCLPPEGPALEGKRYSLCWLPAIEFIADTGNTLKSPPPPVWLAGGWGSASRWMGAFYDAKVSRQIVIIHFFIFGFADEGFR